MMVSGCDFTVAGRRGPESTPSGSLLVCALDGLTLAWLMADSVWPFGADEFVPMRGLQKARLPDQTSLGKETGPQSTPQILH